MREGLLAYVEILRDDARAMYYQDLQLFGLGILKKAPTRPRILEHG
jgi:hypothetical protein